MGQVMGKAMSRPFDLVLGRKTYKIFAAHWPHATDDPGAKPLNDATKYVASRTLSSLDWRNSTFIEGDVGEGIASAQTTGRARAPGPRQREPDPDAVATQPHKRVPLVDLPRRRGARQAPFSDGTIPAGLKRRQQVSTTGVVINTYEPAGEIVTGSFALDEPTEAEIERRHKLEG
jgi:hypothetical protein